MICPSDNQISMSTIMVMRQVYEPVRAMNNKMGIFEDKPTALHEFLTHFRSEKLRQNEPDQTIVYFFVRHPLAVIQY